MITHIRHVALGVPDLDEATSFYKGRWNLEMLRADDDRLYFGAGNAESHVLRLRATAEPRVDLLCLGVESAAEVDAIAERVAQNPNGKLLGGPGPRQDLGGGYAARFLDCDGRTIEVSAGAESREFQPVRERETRPLGISHVVLNTPDLTLTHSFYNAVLGLRISDWVEDFMCFMRAGAAHHLLAFVSSPHASLNHVAYEMLGIDEFMRATGAMMRSGIAPFWGPGRHGVGDNTFSYFQDSSSGFVMEYTTALQLVDDRTWRPQVHPASDEDRWGTSNAMDDNVRSTLRGRPDPGLWIPPPV